MGRVTCVSGDVQRKKEIKRDRNSEKKESGKRLEQMRHSLDRDHNDIWYGSSTSVAH